MSTLHCVMCANLICVYYRFAIHHLRVSLCSASTCGVVFMTRRRVNWSTLPHEPQPTPCFQSSTSRAGLEVRSHSCRTQRPGPPLENSTPVQSTTVGVRVRRFLTLTSATAESLRRDGLWGDSSEQYDHTNRNHPYTDKCQFKWIHHKTI